MNYYEMKNGLVVMQAEDGKFVYSSNSANGNWEETKQFAGEDGTVMLWTGNDYFNKSNAGEKQTAPLEYTFEVDSPGTYYLTLRAIRPVTGEAGDRNNDFFVQFENGDHEKLFFSGDRNEFRWASLIDPGHGEKKVAATYSVTQSMIDKNDGIFTLTISARSSFAGFDEVHFQKGSASRDATAPTSNLITGDGGSDPQPPAEDNDCLLYTSPSPRDA